MRESFLPWVGSVCVCVSYAWPFTPLISVTECLIEEIQRDIAAAKEKLKLPAMAELADQLANWNTSKH